MRRSHDAILVLNAGSSSIKLSVFAERAGELALEVRGEVEALYTAPRFVAQDPSGRVVAEESWPGRKLGHDGAIEYLRDFLKRQPANDRLVGVGHRVVHGGLEYTAPVRVEAETLEALERFIPLAPLHQPHNLSPISLLLERAPELIEPGLVVVSRERFTDVGPVDLFCRDADGRTVVVEVKRVRAVAAHVEQLTRYCQRVDLDPAHAPCRGILVAPEVGPQARVMCDARGYAYVAVSYDQLKADAVPELTLFD